MVKKVLFAFAISFFVALPMFSQSSEEVSAILESEKATIAQISYLPAVYANLISEDDSEAQAVEALKNKGFLNASVNADSEATLAQAAGILVKSLEIKGGLFYTIFKNDRYAFKELKAQGILPQSADPQDSFSGRDFLDLFSSVIEIAEEAQ